MTVRCLDDHEKDRLVAMHTQQIFTQEEIGAAFGVSARTVRRVLEERGIKSPENTKESISKEERAILDVVKQYNLTAEQLANALSSPALTFKNVQVFLNQCTKEELAELFYTAGLYKITEMIGQSKAREQVEEKERKVMGHEEVSH